MDKIGLILAYKSSNYGCQLQAYATQYVIESLGFETIIVDYKPSHFSLSSTNFGLGLFTYIYNSRIERKIRKRTREYISDPQFIQNRNERKVKSDEFIKDRLKNIITFQSYNNLKSFAKGFKAFIIGSDQKWLPGFCYDKISSLTFVPKNSKRISYATSLGVAEYPKYCWNASRKVWDKFDFLSVREKAGAEIVNSICKSNRCLSVLDPTYLISKETWMDLIPPVKIESCEYLLCYFLGNNDSSKLCARSYANKHGLKIISIMTDESFSEYDLIFADKLVTGISPTDFVNLIRYAKVVFTDSFHGMTFSIINNIDFFVFYRKRDDARLNRNSRINNILELFKLKNRLLKEEDTDWENVSTTPINYCEVNGILNSEKDKAYCYLKIALS